MRAAYRFVARHFMGLILALALTVLVVTALTYPALRYAHVLTYGVLGVIATLGTTAHPTLKGRIVAGACAALCWAYVLLLVPL